MSSKSRSEVSICVKYSLFLLNVLFWFVGGLCLAIGIYAKTMKELNKVVENALPWFMDPAILFIIFGAIVFILAFTGCIGALRENVCLLKFYEITIDVIMILELAAAVYIYVDRDRVKDKVKDALKKTIPEYRNDDDLQNIIDFFQQTVKCCGVLTYSDWNNNKYFNCSSSGVEACGVPYSCCKSFKTTINTQCGFGMLKTSVSIHERQNKIYTTGCVDATLSYLTSKENLIILLVTGGVVVFVQLLTTGLAHSLVGGIKLQKLKWSRPPPGRGYGGGRGNEGYF